MQPDGGLSRFRSAPATWLEALLLKDEEELEIQEEPLTFTQLLSNAAGPGPSSSLFPSHSQQYLSSPNPNPITHHDQVHFLLFLCSMLLLLTQTLIHFFYYSPLNKLIDTE